MIWVWYGYFLALCSVKLFDYKPTIISIMYMLSRVHNVLLMLCHGWNVARIVTYYCIARLLLSTAPKALLFFGQEPLSSLAYSFAVMSLVCIG